MKTDPADRHSEQGPAPLAAEFRVERGLRKRSAAILGLVALAFLAVSLTSVFMLYQAAEHKERTAISEMTRSHAHLIGALADVDRDKGEDMAGVAFETALIGFRSACQKSPMAADGRELIIGRVQGDETEFFVCQGSGLGQAPTNTSLNSEFGEPMYRALAGSSGTMTGQDSNSRPVLTAYEPIPNLGAGLVTTVPLAQLRQPYVWAAGAAIGCTLVLTLGCAWLLHRAGMPLVRAAEQSYSDAARVNKALRSRILEHQRTERVLRASESRFREFLDNLGDAAFMLDVEGRVAYANAFAAQLVDRDESQLIGQPFEPLMSADTVSRAQQAYKEVLSGRAADIEVTLVSGKIVHARMEPLRDSDLRIVGVVGIARDVSERRELINALRESEQKYSLLLSNLPGMAYRCRNDGNWTMVFASTGAQVLTGYAPEDLQANRTVAFGDLIHPDDRDLVWSEVQKGIQQKGAYEITYRISTRDGQEKRLWERGRVANSVTGDDVFLEGFITDISERDHAERALRESEARFRAMADNSPVGVYMSDAAGNNVYVNRAICEFTGLRPDDHAGRAWYKTIHPDDRDNVIRMWSDAAERGEYLEHEFRFLSVDGRVTWALSSAVPLRNDAGQLTGFIGTTTDVTAQKRAEMLLRESEHFIRSSLNALSSHIAIIDERGRIGAVNEAWRQFAACNSSNGALLDDGANYLDVCDNVQGDEAQQAQMVARGIREVLAGTRQIFEHEYTCHSPTEERWFVVRVTRFLSNGQPRAVIAHENITACKHAERLLLEQKQLLALVISSIPHSVFWKDTNSVYLGCNDQFARAAGLNINEEIVGKTDYDLAWTRAESDWYRKCDAEVMSSGTSLLDVEETLHAPDGFELTILTSKVPLRNASGQVTGILGIFTDISDRKRTEEKLLLQSAALAAAANAIVITDSGGLIVWTNPAYTTLTGYAAEEALGANIRLQKSGEHPVEFYRQMWTTVLSGKVWHGELVNRRKSGELYTEEMTITPVHTNNIGITHFVAIKHDISERKRHEEERLRLARIERETEGLIQAKRAADAANQAKSDFLANMSHELRTPLNGVITLNELLLKTDLQPTQQRFAYLAKKSGETLLSLINDILDFSKIEAGKLELEELDFALAEVVDQASATVAAAASAKGLELVVSLHPAAPQLLRGDPTRLKQVLTNLINNAIKFTDKGEVHVRVTIDSEAHDRATLRFVVADTGIGIAEDRQDLLFRKFTQADSSTTRKYGGTGLGLAISKRIVQAMGGEIGVYSSPGAGSTFWFTAEFRKDPDTRQQRIAAPMDLRSLRILVVDDSELNREVLVEQLSNLGFSARAVHDGPAALEELRAASANGPYDLAILDHQMPGMDGTELARRVKSDEALNSTVLIMLSSSDECNPTRFRELGFSGWITKPVNSPELLGAIVEAYACAQIIHADPLSTETPANSQASALTATPGDAHILLVDDNEIGQEAGRELLRQYGYTCDIAANGKLAIKAALEGKYDLVLMDCQMPEMDGFEATQILRRCESKGKLLSRRGARLPIVALTANALAGDREKCLAAGMDDYLSKPLDPNALMEMIRRNLCQSAAAQKTDSMIDAATGEDAIDFALLEERWASNASFVHSLLDRFCRDVPPLVDQLAGEIDHGNLDSAARIAHSIKGAAGYVEADCIRAPAAELEQFCRNSQNEQAGQALSQLRREMERCVASIRQHQEEVGPAPSAAQEGPVQ